MAGLAEKIKRDYAAAERAERSAAMAGAAVGPGQDRVAANHEAIVLLAEQLDDLIATLKRATSGARRTSINI